VWIFTRKLVVHLFSRDVFLLQKSIKDQFTLSRKFELVLSEVLLQDPHFSGMLGHGDETDPPGARIKDEMRRPVKCVSIEPISIANPL
jgi:hypothetical protein